MWVCVEGGGACVASRIVASVCLSLICLPSRTHIDTHSQGTSLPVCLSTAMQMSVWVVFFRLQAAHLSIHINKTRTIPCCTQAVSTGNVPMPQHNSAASSVLGGAVQGVVRNSSSGTHSAGNSPWLITPKQHQHNDSTPLRPRQISVTSPSEEAAALQGGLLLASSRKPITTGYSQQQHNNNSSNGSGSAGAQQQHNNSSGSESILTELYRPSSAFKPYTKVPRLQPAQQPNIHTTTHPLHPQPSLQPLFSGASGSAGGFVLVNSVRSSALHKKHLCLLSSSAYSSEADAFC